MTKTEAVRIARRAAWYRTGGSGGYTYCPVCREQIATEWWSPQASTESQRERLVRAELAQHLRVEH